MTTIAQSYIHLAPFDVDADRLTRLGDIAVEIAITSARTNFKSETDLVVRIEEGSLKAWITALNVTLGVYGFVANYKSFKEGIPAIVADARSFADGVNKAFLKAAQVKQSNIVRTERRSKTPGRIAKALRSADWLEAHRSDLSRSQQKMVEAQIAKQLQLAMEDLSYSDQQELLKAIKQTPTMPEAPIEAVRAAIRPREDQMDLAIETLEAPHLGLTSYVAHVRVSESGEPVVLVRQAPT